MSAGPSSTPSPPNKSKSEDSMLPGMVMGPDGKPCKVCTAFRNWRPRTTIPQTDPDPSMRDRSVGGATSASASSKKKPQLESQLAPGLAGAKTNPPSSTKEDAFSRQEPPPGCPPDSEQLGRATWTFLHATAAYYPDKPSLTQRANMLMLLRSLPVLYPCGWCAKDFGEDIENHPPDVRSRVALSRWLCERHNAVNSKLGKESFNCAKVDERWKDGPSDGRCD